MAERIECQKQSTHPQPAAGLNIVTSLLMLNPETEVKHSILILLNITTDIIKPTFNFNFIFTNKIDNIGSSAAVSRISVRVGFNNLQH